MNSADLKPLIFLIAGESSGDQLGAELMKAISLNLKGAVNFIGVGGPLMQAEGLKVFFPSSDIAMMGPSAIIRNFPLLLRRLRQSVDEIILKNPNALVVIDSPEFTQRVARRVRKIAPHIPIVKYVAPQIWAWRKKRAAKMRAYIDEVLALLPFEPEYYRKACGPKTTYVGHPLIMRRDLYELRPEDRRAREEKIPLLAVLPGSRASEVKRLMAPFGETLSALSRSQEFQAAIPVVPHLRDMMEEEIKCWDVKPALVEGQEAKWALFRSARAALAASGTVTLELALAQVPQVVTYKVEPWMTFILRRLIKVDSIVLPNLIIGQKVIPEFYQNEVRAGILAPQLETLLNDSQARQRQLDSYAELAGIMKLPDGGRPADAAAERILAIL
jgi:lipid-A-disaccharide synthase